jgi:hypothetical protein
VGSIPALVLTDDYQLANPPEFRMKVNCSKEGRKVGPKRKNDRESRIWK